MTESGANFEETPVVGGFIGAAVKNYFDTVYSEAVQNLADDTRGSINLRNDINQFIKNPDAIAQFKENMLSQMVLVNSAMLALMRKTFL